MVFNQQCDCTHKPSRVKLYPKTLSKMSAPRKKIAQSEDLTRPINVGLRKDDDNEGQLLCKDFKIQVLPAAFYLNENINFNQSCSGKMSTQGCCC
ncbi:unnamed protein product [Porites evermanni]|uniref:Uncharacterized protein n=1 Tax=Porites evermanni TaxID=104178 RepID=A0ABN8M8I0_9CNID|nr:unnamed protein product [Porites evermanni]